MKELEWVVRELHRRKVTFDEGQLMQVLWDESVKDMLCQGYKEPLKAHDIIFRMHDRSKDVIKVADVLYQAYDRIIEMDFYKTREEDEEVRD